jgi:hypothetical protein
VKIFHQPPVMAIVFVVGATGCDNAGQLSVATPDAAVDVSAEGPGPGPAIIVWGASAPPVEGDGRLVDVGDVAGGFGWDTCFTFPRLVVSEQGASPPPTRGSRYLVASPSGQPDIGRTPALPQAYFWLATPGTAQGLWFDLTVVSGSADAATISFYETDLSCAAKREFGTFSLSTIPLPTGQWKTGCLDLSGQGALGAIGVRIDAASGVLGFDALRFDKSCR